MRSPRAARVLVRALDALGHLFPGLLVAAVAAAAYCVLRAPTALGFLGMCLLPYLAPLALFRALTLATPLKEGASVLARGLYSPWFLSYRLQLVYVHFPFLEGALHCLGLFNVWLRAWGSTIGRHVVWAATAQITDRGHLVVGDDVVFGHAVFLSPHVVQVRNGRGLLYFKRITIGARAFVGAGARMGPGVVVEPGAFVPLLTDLYLKERFPPRTGAA